MIFQLIRFCVKTLKCISLVILRVFLVLNVFIFFQGTPGPMPPGARPMMGGDPQQWRPMMGNEGNFLIFLQDFELIPEKNSIFLGLFMEKN